MYPDLLFEYESSIILEFSLHNKDIGFKFKFFSSCLTTVHVVYTQGPPTQMMIFFFYFLKKTQNDVLHATYLIIRSLMNCNGFERTAFDGKLADFQ